MAWHILREGNGYHHNYIEFMIDEEEDIETPPTDEYTYSVGSRAHTPGYEHCYECDAEGNWVEIVTGGGGGEFIARYS